MATTAHTRRQFVRNLAGSALAFTIVPRHVLGGPGYQAPSDTVNLAAIGAGGMGASNMSRLTSENIVAICDVDWDHVDGAFRDRQGNVRENRIPLREKYEQATRYEDYREMLDKQTDIDAVVIATPDHVHAVAASAAMQLGKHVYVQKPLTWSVHESRMLPKIAAETGVVTQMGNQGHSSDDARRVNEWIRAGAIGPVREVHVWTNRPIWPQGMPRPEQSMDVPRNVNWDLWLGPAPYVPYHEAYMPFAWRGWVDYGVGALGDMGAHLVDHPYWALELTYPETIEATSTPFGTDDGTSSEPGPEAASWPLATLVHYVFPSRGMQPPVEMTWYDGGLMPRRPDVLPADFVLDRGGGVLYIGEKGILMHETYGNNPELFPKHLEEEYADAPQLFDRVEGGNGGHEMNWVNAIKGTDTAVSPFSYAGPLNETMLLGLVALRTGQGVTIEWDGEKGEVVNNADANRYLHREYRDGYGL